MKMRKVSVCFLTIGIIGWFVHIGIFHNQLESVFAGEVFYVRVLPYLIYWVMGCGWMAILDFLGLYRPCRLKPKIRLFLLLLFVGLFFSILFVSIAWILSFAENYLDMVFTVYTDRVVKSLSMAAGASLFMILTSQSKQQ